MTQYTTLADGEAGTPDQHLPGRTNMTVAGLTTSRIRSMLDGPEGKEEPFRSHTGWFQTLLALSEQVLDFQDVEHLEDPQAHEMMCDEVIGWLASLQAALDSRAVAKVDLPVATMRTPEDIELLKARWVSDPGCYEANLEDTEGFESHRDELCKFRNEWERIWSRERTDSGLAVQRRSREKRREMIARATDLGCSLDMLRYVEAVEKKIDRLKRRLDDARVIKRKAKPKNRVSGSIDAA